MPVAIPNIPTASPGTKYSNVVLLPYLSINNEAKAVLNVYIAAFNY